MKLAAHLLLLRLIFLLTACVDQKRGSDADASVIYKWLTTEKSAPSNSEGIAIQFKSGSNIEFYGDEFRGFLAAFHNTWKPYEGNPKITDIGQSDVGNLTFQVGSKTISGKISLGSKLCHISMLGNHGEYFHFPFYLIDHSNRAYKNLDISKWEVKSNGRNSAQNRTSQSDAAQANPKQP